MAESDIDLTDTIDLHLHTAPDVVPRKLDAFEAARQAAARGMRAILLKSHVTITADRAALVEQVVPAVRVFGGLVLNQAVGGFNPAAVEAALRLVPAARAAGVRKILITHPEHPPVLMPALLQEELRDRYAVYFERCLISTEYGDGYLSFAALAAIIRRIGCATTIVATDFGQPQNL